ncbi:hypothetical protein [Segatella hominis]|uniref:Starch-binding module 26 domain-containing protein n=1 Tax=Segatella hominis TaxID=2518605 RepID=A0A4Y8VIG1_9BACT|nr:hypothetical protein [Segatella hominis]TFH80236.1 hypothetical protein EXN75_09155 [Segatella hominis]
MKKRFTLMMMVLCFLMSIPLKMMAFAEVKAVSHYLQPGNWTENDNFKFNTTDGKIYTCKLDNVPSGTQAIWFRIVKEGKEYGPGNGSSSDLVLTGTYQQIFEGTSNALKIVPTSGKTSYTITYNYETNQIKYDAPESGGTEGGGGSTTVDWNTVTTNRLKDHVYTQGFYLAGNFFTFDEKDKINYDDAVFKFQQQNDQSISEAATTPYDVYMVEIPASLTAHAQVMYVDETGKAVKVFGPTSACGISETYPSTEAKSTNWETLNGTVKFSEDNNYWNFVTRNKRPDEYSDGLYEVYIAVDKTTHEPAKWMITHQAKKRVAYFISDAPDATVMPLYDTYKKDDPQFSNKFFATVNLAANRSYYVISNYVRDKLYTEWAKSYGAFNPELHAISCPTTNKLFMLGNGGLEYIGKDPENEVLPNEAPVKINKRNFGVQIVEYNPSKGDDNRCKDNNHFGFIGELILRTDRAVLTSVSLVGDAIPGTLNADKSWNYKSNAADMVYDETEQCYKARVVTTSDAYGKPFRFVGNHDEKITWYENTNTDKNEMAKYPYDSESAPGHTADVNDPNKVDYTEKGDPTSEDYNSWNIIWNRPAGRWTVRLYFHTYSDGNDPKTDYYYTITANRDMELHDLGDVVYGSETNKQNITNLGGYRYMRTWSAQKSWKISDKVDIFVVSSITDDKSGDVKMTLKNINGYVSGGDDHVIPANTGVILATTSEAASKIPGAKFKSREDFTSYNNLVIPMEQYKDDVEYKDQNFLKPILVSRVIPSSDADNYNYLFGYYNAQIATGDKINYGADEYLLGFWISKGSKPYLSNSSYLPIAKEKAATMNRLGTSYDDFGPAVGSAKKVPGVIFDFDNVGGTTGINEVVNQSTKLNDGKYYTLSGQQVEKPTAGGIYIHNGRKFVVK